MSIKRTFWEKLLGKTSKDVIEKDKNGNVIGKTVYTFDKKTGEVIGQLDCVFDPANNHFIKQKNKTYKLTPDGKDPLETTYFDAQGRIQKQKNYNRDASGMMCCSQYKYIYSGNGEKLESSYDFSKYDGGAWTVMDKQENVYDSYGKLTQQNTFEHSPTQHGLVCTKEKTFVRNEDGSYDPQKTVYRDLEGHTTKKKSYWREKTDLSERPLLFGKEESLDRIWTAVYYSGKWEDVKKLHLEQKAEKTSQDRNSSLKKRLQKGSDIPSPVVKKGMEQE